MEPVRLDVFSDVACPWCKAGHERLREALREEPAGSVEVLHRAYELLPGTTRTAHRLVKVAAHFGRATEALDALHAAEDGSDPVPVVARAASLDERALRAALEEGIGIPEVEEDLALAQRLDVRAVPYFVAGGRVALAGAQEPPVLRRLLQAARERQAAAR